MPDGAGYPAAVRPRAKTDDLGSSAERGRGHRTPFLAVSSLCVSLQFGMGARQLSRIDGSPQFAAQIGSPVARYRGRYTVPDSWRRCPCRVFPVTNEKENRMHIKLFRALKAANLTDDAAAEVVEAIEEYIAVKVQEANKGLESKLTAQTWVIGSVGFVLAVIGLAPAFVKLFS